MAELWLLPDTLRCTSDYALEEARRNLRSAEQQARLGDLLVDMSVVEGLVPLPEAIELVAKDRPILQAAIYSRATHLLTGDKRHFRHLDGHRVAGVLIQRPGDYLRLHQADKSS